MRRRRQRAGRDPDVRGAERAGPHRACVDSHVGREDRPRGHRAFLDVAWSVEYRQTGLFAPPGIAAGDGVVVFLDTSGLVALDARDGRERWRRAFPTGPGVISPVAGDGIVVVAAETVPSVAPPRIEAFHLHDGSPAWTASGLPPMQVLFLSWVGEVVFVSGWDNEIVDVVVDGTTGAMRWLPPGSLVSGAGDLAITRAGGVGDPAAVAGLVGVDSATGQERWRVPGDGATASSAGVVTWRMGPLPVQPPADGSAVHVPTSLTGRDAADGSERWTADAVLGAVVNDLALLVHREGTIEGVGVAAGEHGWATAWPVEATPPPIGLAGIGDDSVVVVLAADQTRLEMPESCASG